jgi:hypothetical protein
LLRKLAGRSGLTAVLDAALTQKGMFPQLSKGLLDGALKQVPAPFRRKILVRVDGARASHDLVGHLLGMSSPRKILLFTCSWMITASDEAALMA